MNYYRYKYILWAFCRDIYDRKNQSQMIVEQQ